MKAISVGELFGAVTCFAILFAMLSYFDLAFWPLAVLLATVMICLLGLFRSRDGLRAAFAGYLYGVAAEFTALLWVGHIGIAIGSSTLVFPFTHFFLGGKAGGTGPTMFYTGMEASSFTREWMVLFLAPLLTGGAFSFISTVSWLLQRSPTFAQFTMRLTKNSVLVAAVLAVASATIGYGWLAVYSWDRRTLSAVLASIYAAPFVLSVAITRRWDPRQSAATFCE